MGKGPAKYDDLTKKASDLLDDSVNGGPSFVHGNSGFEINTKGPNSTEFTCSAGEVSAVCKPMSTLKTEFIVTPAGDTPTLATKSALDCKQAVAGLKLKVAHKSTGSELKSMKVAAEYSHEMAFVNADIDPIAKNQPKNLAVCAALGMDGLVGGFKFTSKDKDTYNVGVKYAFSDIETAVTMDEKQNYSMSFYHKVSGDTEIAAKAGKSKDGAFATFGGQYTDGDAAYKAKYDTGSGDVCVTYSQKLNKNVTLMLGTKFAGLDFASAGDCGFQINYSA